MLDLPVIGFTRRVVLTVIIALLAVAGAIATPWLLRSSGETIAFVTGLFAALMFLIAIIGSLVLVVSANRARSRRPGPPIAALDVRPGEPFTLPVAGRGGRHGVWMSFDLARDPRPARETRYDIHLDLTVEIPGRAPTTTPLALTWWSGMLEPHVANLRGLHQPDGRTGPRYHLDLDSTGGRFRAHVMLLELDDVPSGSTATIHGVLPVPAGFTSGRARLFVTHT